MILVFGGRGMIGSAIVDLLHARPASESVRLEGVDLVCEYIKLIRPKAIINAAWPKSNHVQCFENVLECAVDFWRQWGIPGCLISIASVYATLPPRFEIYPAGMYKDPSYVADKAAIVALTRFWARKVCGTGIRVNAVSPGGVYRNERDEPQTFVDAYTGHTNHNRMLPATAVAQACKFLVDCAWVTGQNLIVADGFDL